MNSTINLNPFKSTPFNPHSVGSFVNVTMDNPYSNCGLLCRSDINREIPRKNSWDLLFFWSRGLFTDVQGSGDFLSNLQVLVLGLIYNFLSIKRLSYFMSSSSLFPIHPLLSPPSFPLPFLILFPLNIPYHS